MNHSPLLATGTCLSCFLSLDNLDLVQYSVFSDWTDFIYDSKPCIPKLSGKG